jgi:hypothetical protein
MGEMIEIFCEECGYRKGFSLGVGMLYHALVDVLSEAAPSSRTEIRNIIRNYDVLEEGGEHTIFRCEKCNQLYERFHVRIVYKTHGEKRTYETHHFCSKCHTELTPVNTSDESDEEDYRADSEILTPFIKQLPCPKCAKKSLVIQNSGYWD